MKPAKLRNGTTTHSASPKEIWVKVLVPAGALVRRSPPSVSSNPPRSAAPLRSAQFRSLAPLSSALGILSGCGVVCSSLGCGLLGYSALASLSRDLWSLSSWAVGISSASGSRPHSGAATTTRHRTAPGSARLKREQTATQQQRLPRPSARGDRGAVRAGTRTQHTRTHYTQRQMSNGGGTGGLYYPRPAAMVHSREKKTTAPATVPETRQSETVERIQDDT